jgi:hypothetical protein
MGIKSSDRETIPLCWVHHQAFHEGSGPFDGWTRSERARWQEERVEECLAAHALFITHGGTIEMSDVTHIKAALVRGRKR